MTLSKRYKLYRTGGPIKPKDSGVAPMEPVVVHGFRDKQTRQFYNEMQDTAPNTYYAMMKLGETPLQEFAPNTKIYDELEGSGKTLGFPRVRREKGYGSAYGHAQAAGQYNPFTSTATIYNAFNQSMPNQAEILREELAHKVQFNTDAVATGVKLFDQDLLGLFGVDPYTNKKSVEYQAHKVISPTIHDVYKAYKAEANQDQKLENGGPIDPKKFFNQYINSPKYKERLEKQGYSHPDVTQKMRTYMLNSAKVTETPGLGSSYRADDGINIDPEEVKTYYQNKQITKAHEYSHAAGAMPHGSNYPEPLNAKEQQEIGKRNLFYSPDILKQGHDGRPAEMKADIDALRYRMKVDGMYDAGTQDLDMETLQKAKKRYGSTSDHGRLFSVSKSDEDLLWLMNNIAQNNLPQTGMTMAAYGGQLNARYKKYLPGGNLQDAMGATDAAGGMGGAIGKGAAMIGGLADALGPADQYGKKPLASNILGNAGSMASMGASFGPWGAAAGAVIGAGMGIIQNGQQRREAKKLQFMENLHDYQTTQRQSQARIAADPTLLKGNLAANYYAAGGHLNVASQPVVDGEAEVLSSTSAEFKGPSHEQGGIKLPAAKAEVEGKETTNGTYVFSSRLGFAQIHKPIAKAIGTIEEKAMSPERLNSLNLLRDKEQQLQQSQESLKAHLGLN